MYFVVENFNVTFARIMKVINERDFSKIQKQRDKGNFTGNFIVDIKF